VDPVVAAEGGSDERRHGDGEEKKPAEKDEIVLGRLLPAEQKSF
jgi:hypothetical protein